MRNIAEFIEPTGLKQESHESTLFPPIDQWCRAWMAGRGPDPGCSGVQLRGESRTRIHSRSQSDIDITIVIWPRVSDEMISSDIKNIGNCLNKL